MIDIKRAVSEKRKVNFLYYCKGFLYYETEFSEIFPVPISDAGDAFFNAEDKAILFMRYMKAFNKSLASCDA